MPASEIVCWGCDKMSGRQATDWTDKVYPKDHDTTLDHPGRARMALGKVTQLSLCELQRLYTAANKANSLIEFIEWLDTRAQEAYDA